MAMTLGTPAQSNETHYKHRNKTSGLTNIIQLTKLTLSKRHLSDNVFSVILMGLVGGLNPGSSLPVWKLHLFMLVWGFLQVLKTF